MQQKGNIKQHYGERWGYGVLRKLQSRAALDWGGKCGALGADSSCLQPRCVSLSHCALLAPSSAEEALQHTQAVHHHHSPRIVCVLVCVCTHVCVLSQSLWGDTNSQVTNKLTAATIALTPVPSLYPNKPGTSSAFFPSASERAAYISDAARSHKFTPPKVQSKKKNFLYKKSAKYRLHWR